jgi:hypothetical protein
MSVEKTSGGGTLIAISDGVSAFIRKNDLELAEECVCVETPWSDDFNSRNGYGNDTPDTTVDTFGWYFGCQEHVFDIHNFRVLLLGDSIVPFFRLATWSTLLLFITTTTN